MTAGEVQALGVQSPDADFDEDRVVEEPTERFVCFRLGTEWYGIPIVSAREVVHAGQIAHLPSAPAYVVGLMNLRGSIVCVADPKRIFGLPPTDASDSCRVVVIESGNARAGLLVDEAGGVVEVTISRLEPPLATLEPSQAAFIEHTCRAGDRLLAILKAEPLLQAASAGGVIES